MSKAGGENVCIFQHFYSFMRCRWDHYGKVERNHKKNEDFFTNLSVGHQRTVNRNWVFYCPLHHVMISDKRVVEVVQSSIFCFGSKQVYDPFFVCFVKLVTIYRISKNSVVLLLHCSKLHDWSLYVCYLITRIFAMKNAYASTLTDCIWNNPSSSYIIVIENEGNCTLPIRPVWQPNWH